MPKLIKPRALKAGDTVAIVAPSSCSSKPAALQFAIDALGRLGLKVKTGRHVSSSWGDFAGSDSQRLDDLHSAFADKKVSAIFPIRGGNGAARLLGGLDFDLIRKNPKVLIGFSDITALLISIYQETGLVTFHGPTAGRFFKCSYTSDSLVNAVMKPSKMGEIEDPESSDANPQYPPFRIPVSKGSARGRLTGGCLTLIRQLMGTPWEIETKGKIVFLEDVAEEPHNIDRVLGQLLLSGKLQRAAGIIIGDCVGCAPYESDRNAFSLNKSLEQIVRDRLGGLGVPVVYGLRIGHSRSQATLPIGVTASLEVSKKEVKFAIEENATTS